LLEPLLDLGTDIVVIKGYLMIKRQDWLVTVKMECDDMIPMVGQLKFAELDDQALEKD
jgi:hypothetical protein